MTNNFYYITFAKITPEALRRLNKPIHKAFKKQFETSLHYFYDKAQGDAHFSFDPQTYHGHAKEASVLMHYFIQGYLAAHAL